MLIGGLWKKDGIIQGLSVPTVGSGYDGREIRCNAQICCDII